MNKSYLMLAVAAVALGFGAYQMQQSVSTTDSGSATMQTASSDMGAAMNDIMPAAGVEMGAEQILEFSGEMAGAAETIAVQTSSKLGNMAAETAATMSDIGTSTEAAMDETAMGEMAESLDSITPASGEEHAEEAVEAVDAAEHAVDAVEEHTEEHAEEAVEGAADKAVDAVKDAAHDHGAH